MVSRRASSACSRSEPGSGWPMCTGTKPDAGVHTFSRLIPGRLLSYIPGPAVQLRRLLGSGQRPRAVGHVCDTARMDDTWWSRDLPVLDVTVRLLQDHDIAKVID